MKKIFFVLILTFFAAPFFARDWYVCVGSYKFRRNAQFLQNELKKAKIAAFIEPAFLEDGLRVYRVMIDKPFSSPRDAEQSCRNFSKSRFAVSKKIKSAWVCDAPIHSGGDYPNYNSSFTDYSSNLPEIVIEQKY